MKSESGISEISGFPPGINLISPEIKLFEFIRNFPNFAVRYFINCHRMIKQSARMIKLHFKRKILPIPNPLLPAKSDIAVLCRR